MRASSSDSVNVPIRRTISQMMMDEHRRPTPRSPPFSVDRGSGTVATWVMNQPGPASGAARYWAATTVEPAVGRGRVRLRIAASHGRWRLSCTWVPTGQSTELEPTPEPSPAPTSSSSRRGGGGAAETEPAPAPSTSSRRRLGATGCSSNRLGGAPKPEPEPAPSSSSRRRLGGGGQPASSNRLGGPAAPPQVDGWVEPPEPEST